MGLHERDNGGKVDLIKQVSYYYMLCRVETFVKASRVLNLGTLGFLCLDFVRTLHKRVLFNTLKRSGTAVADFFKISIIPLCFLVKENTHSEDMFCSCVK